MKSTTSKAPASENSPTYLAYFVTPAPRGQKGRWSRIGAFFPHEDGEGGTLLLDSIPIAFDGRIVLRKPRPDTDQPEAQ